MSASRTDQIAKARAAWGEGVPAEVLALATACRSRSQRAVAQQLGYSEATISYVLSNKYQNGDIPKVFAKIRGAFMGETVMCPILDEIGRDRCLSEQAKPFAATNSTRARLFHACKTCPHRQQRDAA